MLPLELLVIALAPVAYADRQHFDASEAYNNGELGKFPNQTFASSNEVAPRLNFLKRDPLPERGLFTLLGLRGHSMKKQGPMILDSNGNLVWFSSKWPNPYNLQVQEYKVAKYLTFWSGEEGSKSHGRGYYYMLDSSYKQILRIRAKNGLFGDWGDQHEFLITKQGTAVLMIYEKKKVDLSSVVKNRGSGWIWDCLFQEIDLGTRRVIFRWRASDVFSLDYSYLPIKNKGSYHAPWDWFHLNSIDKDEAGNYLLSARYTNAITYISGRDGSIIWNLGGKHNDFLDKSDGAATNFTFQHDARWHGEDAISLFDNAADDTHRKGISRGMLVSIDTESIPKTVHLRQQFLHPDGITSVSQGNVQVLRHGRVLVGWGLAGSWTEFTGNGSVVEDVRFQPASEFLTGNVQSYRTFKMRWQGFPRTQPSLVIKDSAAYVSWNGATEVNSWVLQCVHSSWFAQANDWSAVVSEQRQGFETVLDFDEHTLKKWVRVVAFDVEGNVLSMTRTVDWKFARRPLPQAYFISDPSALIWYVVISFVLILILLRVSRRFTRRFYVWKGSKRRNSNGLMHKLLPTTNSKR